jgi:hypothetical protein
MYDNHIIVFFRTMTMLRLIFRHKVKMVSTAFATRNSVNSLVNQNVHYIGIHCKDILDKFHFLYISVCLIGVILIFPLVYLNIIPIICVFRLLQICSSDIVVPSTKAPGKPLRRVSHQKPSWGF